MDHKFQKLTPTHDVELGIYEDAIEYSFSEADIRNIAISGAYGAGKSSVLETYKDKHPERKFLHISLAHFDDVSAEAQETEVDAKEDDSTGNPAEKEKDKPKRLSLEAILEGKIINQLIHQVDPEQIPMTDFKVKREADENRLWDYTMWCLGFCLLLLFVIFHKWWCRLVSGLGLGPAAAALLKSHVLVLLAVIVLVVISAKGIFALMKIQSEKKILKKISLQGNDIEILGDCKDSYFDKYLNEVLYLFEHVDADAIVFEDMDRFETNAIFEKLREISFLVGKRREKNPLRFFYLLRDDMFESSDRTKFFDFIIPVVPVVDGSNAYDKFIEKFDDAGVAKCFSEDFLFGLSLFIDDMRLLTNILNEFLIYRSRLETTPIGRSDDKLLALITYKNLFPKDFNELQVKRGYVYTLFASKERFCREEMDALQAEIDRLEEALEASDREAWTTIEELNALYFKSNKTLRVQGKKEEEFETRVDFVAAILAHPKEVEYEYHQAYSTYWGDYNVQAMVDKFQKNEEYQKRKAAIELQGETERDEVQTDILQLERQKDILGNMKLKDCITRANAEKIFSVTYTNPLGEEQEFKEIKRSSYFPLIQYLIQDGYIDETYPDYMTYFYENSLKAGDKKYLSAVIGRNTRNFEYSYSLKDPGLVISRLKEAYFREEETLNFDVLDFLLEHSAEYEAKLDLLMRQVLDTKPKEFISQYLQHSQHAKENDLPQLEENRRKFVAIMNKEWSGVFTWIMLEKEFSSVRANYITDSFCVSSDKEIVALNQGNFLKKYIEQHTEVCAISDEDVEKFMHGIQLLDVKVEKFDYESINPNLFERMYRSDAYQLNPQTVNVILEHVYLISPMDIDWEMNLTQIFWKTEEPLAGYVEENIADYLKIVLAQVEEIHDSEENVQYVLNSDEIADADKQAYIKKLKTSIRFLREIKNKSLWKSLLDQEIIVDNSANMCDYYFKSENGLDESLIRYINQSKKALTVENVAFDESYGEDAKVDFFDEVVLCDDLNDAKYEELVKSFELHYGELAIEDLSPEKLWILIRNQIVPMAEETWTFIDKEYIPRWLEEEVQIPIDLLKSLLAQENIELEERMALLALQLNITKAFDIRTLKECLESMKLEKYLNLLGGKRPTFEINDGNEKLLSALQNRGWVSSYKEDPQNPGYYKAYSRKRFS